MRKSGPIFIAGLVFISLWIGLLASARAQSSPIRIGTSLSQTGTFAALGQVQLHGYTLCVKHTNDKAGLLGRKLELVAYDDQSDPATAVRAYSTARRSLIEPFDLRFIRIEEGLCISGSGTNGISHWQDGEKVILSLEELALGKPHFPTPPWSQRQ